MSKKLIVLLACCCFLVGLLFGWRIGLPVLEVEVIDREITLSFFVLVLRDYYNISVTYKSQPFFSGFIDRVFIIPFESWVRFLQAHGIRECYRLRSKARLWVEVDGYIYEWGFERP